MYTEEDRSLNKYIYEYPKKTEKLERPERDDKISLQFLNSVRATSTQSWKGNERCIHLSQVCGTAATPFQNDYKRSDCINGGDFFSS